MCDASEEEMDKVNVLKQLHVDGEWAFFFNPGFTKDKCHCFFVTNKRSFETCSWYSSCVQSNLFKGAVSRNSVKLGNYKMPVKFRET